jgi:hypothetical protein
MSANTILLYSDEKMNLPLQSKRGHTSPLRPQLLLQLQPEIKVGCPLFNAVGYPIGF